MRVLYLVAEDWYFVSHRIDLAAAARARGDEVIVATRVKDHGGEIVDRGLHLVPMDFERLRVWPVPEARLVWDIVRLYRDLEPDLVHHVALKPILYGSLAARIAGIRRLVATFAGLGVLVSSRSRWTRMLRSTLMICFRTLLNGGNSRVIVQNPDDLDLMSTVVRREKLRLIRGSGVDTTRFVPQPEPQGIPLVLFASRLLWDKGVGEFVDAARILHEAGVEARFVVVGSGDSGSTNSVPDEQMKMWQAERVIEWWGRRADMVEVIAGSNIVCLPSYYGEGIPMILLEALSSGRAIVAADSQGCREVVDHGANGLLVPPRDSAALAAALQTLIEAETLREEMGRRGREIAEAEFSVQRVIRETLAVYDEDLSPT